MIGQIDVLYCVEKRDINFLFAKSLQLCVENFQPLNDIYIVTNCLDGVRNLLERLDLPVNCHIFSDEYFVGTKKISGWFVQQIIKLKANMICKTEYICIIGADALLMHPVTKNDLFEGKDQIIYYNRYPFTWNHLEYERKRVENVANILHCTPSHSYLLGDFIMELMIFKSSYLKQLNQYLSNIYGDEPILKIIQNLPHQSITDKSCFGEWTLYAVFLLDILNLPLCVRNSNNQFVEQLHTIRDLPLHSSNAKIVHCVCKDIDREEWANALKIRFEENLN